RRWLPSASAPPPSAPLLVVAAGSRGGAGDQARKGKQSPDRLIRRANPGPRGLAFAGGDPVLQATQVVNRSRQFGHRARADVTPHRTPRDVLIAVVITPAADLLPRHVPASCTRAVESHFTMPGESAANGPRVTTRGLLTQSRQGDPVTTPVRTQGRALGVGHTDDLYAFTGRVWRASGYEQGAVKRNTAWPREALRQPLKA